MRRSRVLYPAYVLCAGLIGLFLSFPVGAERSKKVENSAARRLSGSERTPVLQGASLAAIRRWVGPRLREGLRNQHEAVVTVVAQPLAMELERRRWRASAYVDGVSHGASDRLLGVATRVRRLVRHGKLETLPSVADVLAVVPPTPRNGKAQECVVEIPRGRRIVDPSLVLDGPSVEAHSYDPKKRRLTIIAENPLAVLQELKLTPNVLRNAIEYLGGWYIPRKDALSLDYWRHRMAQISAASLGAAVGIYTTQAADQAKVATYTNLQQAVESGMSGVEALDQAQKGIAAAALITGAAVPVATKVVNLFFSRYLAPLGDRNPKRMFLLSTLLAGGTSIGSTAAMLHWADHFGLVTVISAMAGALAGAVGLGVGVNIFNHLAQDEHARGEVNARNHNQDQLAFIVGVGVVFGLSQLISPLIAAALGTDQQTVALTGLGALMLGSSFWAARGLRLEQLTREDLRKLVDGQLAGRGVEPARWQTSAEVLAGLFRDPRQGEFSARTVFTPSLTEALGLRDRPQDADRLRNLFAGGDYLLRVSSDDRVVVGLNPEASFSNVVRALMHVRLVEHGLDAPLLGALQERYGDRSRLAIVELAARALPDTGGVEKAYREAGWHSNHRALRFNRLPEDATWRSDSPVALSAAALGDYYKMAQDPAGHQQAIANALSEYPIEQGQPAQSRVVRLKHH